MGVEWKSISSIKGYEQHVDVEVSSDGEVRGNDAKGKEVKITIGKQRPKLHLKNEPPEVDTPPVALHTLVAELFIEKPTGTNLEVHHLDRNSKNNKASNLVWLPQKEHREKHGML